MVKTGCSAGNPVVVLGRGRTLLKRQRFREGDAQPVWEESGSLIDPLAYVVSSKAPNGVSANKSSVSALSTLPEKFVDANLHLPVSG